MIIDFRVRPPLKSFGNSGLYVKNRPPRTRPPVESARCTEDFSMQTFLTEMEEARIDKAVVPVRISAPGASNEELSAFVEKNPGKFFGLAGVEALHTAEAIAAAEKFVLNGNCSGLVIELGFDREPWFPDDKRAYPFYDFCQSNNILLGITCGGIFVPSLKYMDPLAIDRIAADFPDLRMVIFHGGWPYVTEFCQIAMWRRNVYLCPDLYMNKAPGSMDYIMGANYMVIDKIVYGSAAPLASMKEMVDHYMNCGLAPEAVEHVMCLNAKRLLGLD